MWRRIMRKFVWIGIGVLSLVAGFQVKAIEKGQVDGLTSDSLIVYQAEDDSLRAQLVAEEVLNLKSKPEKYSNKRVEQALDDEKTPVHPRDLPSAIKETLSGDEFKDWKTASVSLVKPVRGQSYYEIALLKENTAKIAKFKGNGKVL